MRDNIGKLLFEIWKRKHYPNVDWICGLMFLITLGLEISSVFIAIFNITNYKLYLSLAVIGIMLYKASQLIHRYVINKFLDRHG